MELKRCKVCNEEKRVSEFNKSRTCKACAALLRRPASKVCKSCGEDKPIDEFAKGKQLCKSCLPDPIATGLKRCPTCKQVLPVINFHKSSTTVDGLAGVCKACASSAHITRKATYDYNTIDMSQRKVCTQCGVEKQFSEFYPKVGSKGGVNSMCKLCCKDNIYTYRDENPEVVKATQLRSYHKDVQYSREKAKAWRLAHPDALEALRVYGREYRKIHKETLRVKDRDRYLKNTTRYKYYRDKRKALVKNTPGRYTADDIAAIWEHQLGTCVYCGVDLASTTVNIDHYMPLHLGGTNWPSNLQLLCESCNKRKWAKLPEVYEAEIGFDREAYNACINAGVAAP